MDDKLKSLTEGRIIVPSCENADQLSYIVEETSWPCVMLKMGEVSNIKKITAYIHKYHKKVMVHLDSVKGIAKDKEGILYLKNADVEAVITMRAKNVKLINEAGMTSMLGAFLVDSASVAQTIKNVANYKPDILIAMPITIPDIIFNKLTRHTTLPIMGGGLGVSEHVIDHALNIGMEACAVTDPHILDDYEHRYLD